MSLLVHVLADMIHLAKMVVLFEMFFVFRKREFEHNKLVFCLSCLVMSGVSIFVYCHKDFIIETFVYIIVTMLLMSILYKEKIYYVVIVTTWMMFALSMIDTMSSVLFDVSTNLFKIDAETISRLGVSIISFLLVYVVGSIYKKNASAGIKSIGIVNLFWFSILLAIDTFVVTVMTYISVDLYMEKYKSLYMVSVVLVIIGIFIQLGAVILLSMQRNLYREKKLLTEKYLDEQKSHYEYLENREKETKKFRHDFRSHLELISNMARKQEYDKMQDYLEKMHIKIDELGNIVTVHNGIVDAIINQYYVKALQHGIKMEVKGRFPGDCNIDAFDACTIFSNILSNAIEAAEETPEKYVSIECRYNDRNIIIVVKNSFCSEQRGVSDLLKTQKGNLDYHGYGIENMKDSVYKYEGVIDVETEGHIFILTILLNNKGNLKNENFNCG